MDWYFVYTNEAHPGEHLEHHRTFEDKAAAATRLRDEIGIRREILLDDLGGTVHQAYSMCPNMTWVIARGGTILYKSMWTSAERVAEFCEGMKGFGLPGTAPFYTEQIEMRKPDREMFQERLAINGPRSVAEFARAGEFWQQRAREEAKRRRGKA